VPLLNMACSEHRCALLVTSTAGGRPAPRLKLKSPSGKMFFRKDVLAGVAFDGGDLSS
jgi:hypothetical protein